MPQYSARTTILRVLIFGVVTLASSSCANRKVVRIHNESGSQVGSRHMGQPISIAPGETAHFVIAKSRTVGLSLPLLEARRRVSEKYKSIHLNGVIYSFPQDYIESLENWENQPWLSQTFNSDAGQLVYSSPARVVLTHRNWKWSLREEAPAQLLEDSERTQN